jgi:RHS repeat-associated protein
MAKADGAVKQGFHYYPYGRVIEDEGTWPNYQPYKYGGKEEEPMHGVGLYDFHARWLSYRDVPYTLTMDPLCENYYSWSPYSWCAGNPIRNVDPTGCSTWVSLLPNGTFQVIGGDSEDDDLNIYAGYYNKDGAFVRGNSIGTTTSTTSFYDSYANNGKGDWAKESIIDPKDNSGDIFLQGLVNDDPSLVSYMLNATKGEKYDFKATNNTNEVQYDKF